MIYIVLPVYNEEKNIARVIRDIRRVLKGRKHQIVAVNDGSKDKTLKILEHLKKADLHIESHELNMNVGAVFATGIGYVYGKAKANDVMVIMESDGTSSAEILTALVDEIELNKQDIVIASRYLKGGGYRNFPISRQIISWAANFIMRLYFPLKNVWDYTIFYRAYRVGTIRKAINYFGQFGLIQSHGFVANAELLIKLTLFTEKVSGIPFIYDYGQKEGASKIGISRTLNEYISVISYLRDIVKRNDLVNSKMR
jgi:dolichol-phosphate mannosyltransferase